MNVKVFLDTNILIYAFSKDPIRQAKALSLLENRPYLSTQVLTECCNVCLKKLNFSQDNLANLIFQLKQHTEILTITPEMIVKALKINKEYQFGFYDSLIISTSIISGCQTLFSEDMQHQQVIEHLTIINPFKT